MGLSLEEEGGESLSEVNTTSGMIRRAATAAPPQILTYMKNLATEPDLYLPMATEEFPLTLAEEDEMMAQHEARDNALALIAVTAAGRVIGMGSTCPALQHARSGCPLHETTAANASEQHHFTLASHARRSPRLSTGSNSRSMRKMGQPFIFTNSVASPSKGATARFLSMWALS